MNYMHISGFSLGLFSVVLRHATFPHYMYTVVADCVGITLVCTSTRETHPQQSIDHTLSHVTREMKHQARTMEA